jgi:predicted phosphodiesterase
LYNEPFQRLKSEGRFSIILNGHTHKTMVRRFDAMTIINAGTLFREHNAGFLFIDFAAREVQRFLFDEGLVVRLEKKESF